MAVTTSIARHYAVRLIVMMIVMLVLGVWGVYDYAFAIPAKQERFERFNVMQLTQRALQPDLAAEEQDAARSEAQNAIDESLLEMVNEHAGSVGVEPFSTTNPDWRAVMLLLASGEIETTQEAEESEDLKRYTSVLESVRAANDENWFKALLLCDQGLRAPRQTGSQLSGMSQQVYEFTTKQINEISPDGSVPPPPSKFDRAMQWMFILCLPCVPYFLWVYLGTVRQVYTLEDDGSLQMPQGTWPADDIADIDMDRWMAKSIAHVVHKDGRRVMLDDYKFKNMHRIVGELAHRFHPEAWTAEAKPVKEAAEGESEGDSEPLDDDRDPLAT